MGIKGFLTTLGLGVGAMYFMDPERVRSAGPTFAIR